MPDKAPDPGKMSLDELQAQIEHLDGDIEMETGDSGADLWDRDGVPVSEATSTLGFGGLAGRDVGQLRARRAALQAELDSRLNGGFDPQAPPATPPSPKDEGPDGGPDRQEIGTSDDDTVRQEIGGPPDDAPVLNTPQFLPPMPWLEVPSANPAPVGDVNGDGAAEIRTPATQGSPSSSATSEGPARPTTPGVGSWRDSLKRPPLIAVAGGAAAVLVVLAVLAVKQATSGSSPTQTPGEIAAGAAAAAAALGASGGSTPVAAGGAASGGSAEVSDCGPHGKSNGSEDVAVSGAVSAHVTQDCGAGGPYQNPTHCTVQVLPIGNAPTPSYTYDMYGGFFTNGVHYDLHFPGTGVGPAYTHVLASQAATFQTLGSGHVTMTSYSTATAAVPVTTWQSTTAGTMSWTANTVTLDGVVLTATPNSPQPADPVTINGTWKVYGCSGQ